MHYDFNYKKKYPLKDLIKLRIKFSFNFIFDLIKPENLHRRGFPSRHYLYLIDIRIKNKFGYFWIYDNIKNKGFFIKLDRRI